MSDGMSDAAAVGRLGNAVVDAAYGLRDALKAADAGHRGVSVDALEDINRVLRDAGYELRRLPPR